MSEIFHALCKSLSGKHFRRLIFLSRSLCVVVGGSGGNDISDNANKHRRWLILSSRILYSRSNMAFLVYNLHIYIGLFFTLVSPLPSCFGS